MTLEEFCESNTMDVNEKKFVNIGRVTAEIIWQSLEKGRLWCGGYELANLIKSSPENLMFCILPEVPQSNVAASIEHTLIQAICWENNIRILRVDNRQALSHLIFGNKRKKNKNENQTVSCVLLEYPPEKLSTEEKEVYDFYKWMKVTGQCSSRVIQLPV